MCHCKCSLIWTQCWTSWILSRPICFTWPMSSMRCRSKPDGYFVKHLKQFRILVTSSWIILHTMCWKCIMITIRGKHNSWKLIYLVTPTHFLWYHTKQKVIKLNCWKMEYVCDKKVLKYNYYRQWRQAKKIHVIFCDLYTRVVQKL